MKISNSTPRKCRSGFTVFELIIVIIFIGLLVWGIHWGIQEGGILLTEGHVKPLTQAETTADTATQTTNPEQHVKIVVKGLFIGLNYNSFASVVAQKFDGGQWQIENVSYPYCLIQNLELEKLRSSYMQLGAETVPKDMQTESSIKIDVTFDSSGNLDYVFIPHLCAGYLFSSSGMTANEFMENFCAAYSIPDMSRDVASDGTGFWKYTSPDNVTVKITDDKDVSIEKSESQNAVQSRFN